MREPSSPPARQPPIDLNAFRRTVYSQGGEEGMLEKIFELVPPTERFCVEFGASDGLRNSNTALFVRERGFRGVFLEGSNDRYAKLAANYAAVPHARLVHARVQPDTIEQLFDAAEVPSRFDLLSIDIDGNDYWVWRALERHRPRVLVIEYNPYYQPPARWVMAFNPDHAWDGTTYYGASLASLVALSREKGYELVGCDGNGNNAFFVEAAYLPRFGLADNSAEALFRPAFYKVRFVGKNTFVTGHPFRDGPAEAL